MSVIVKEKKYQFKSTVRLPDMDEIMEAASDFSEPTDKKIVIGNSKQDIKEIAKKAAYSKEQAEMNKLGMAVVEAEMKRAKEKELARAEELRRLCRERELMAKKRQEEEEMKAKGIKVVPTETSSETAPEAPEMERSQDEISEIAINPFDAKKPVTKEKAEKEEFKETILQDDYTDEMEFLEDSSESVDDDFLDF
ncbi:MAG: hypothetical protein J6Y08_00930 [Clostridiales bacterium]|nr:hypothetical protein [Clostridiales bacterium]